MAKLEIKKNNQHIFSLDLKSDLIYYAGRDSECEIHLNHSRGISRKHLKIFYNGKNWEVQLLSKINNLKYNNKTINHFELEESSTFEVGPFNFDFKDSKTSIQPENNLEIELENTNERIDNSFSNPSLNKLASVNNSSIQSINSNINIQQNNFNNEQINSNNSPSIEGNLDATNPGFQKLTAILTVKYPGNQKREIFELEGNVWVAGRDSNCEIYLDYKNASRKHFELNRTPEGVYITDLESANFTELNGNTIPSNTPVPLNSGDKIKIMDLEILFELKDSQFEQKVGMIQKNALEPIPINFEPVQNQQPMAPYNPSIYFDPNMPAVLKVNLDNPTRSKKSGFFKKENKIRILLVGGIIILLIAFIFKTPEKNSKKADLSSSEPSSKMDQLTPQQKTALKDMINLARGHSTQGRYEFCLSEISKIHEIVPFFEDSKSLESHCIQGSELVRENQDLERKEREKKEALLKINAIVSECEKSLKNSLSLDEGNSCLGPAIELDPSNPDIIRILSEIENRVEIKKKQNEQQNIYNNNVQLGISLYKKAKNSYGSGKLRLSIQEYQKFLSENLPDPKGLKKIANRELASIKQKLDEKVNKSLNECKSNYKSKAYKLAVENCNQALSEDPEHVEANEVKQQAISDMKLELKSIYEDSILEESLGEIEGAKEKWKKIIQLDIKGGDYYQKATRKLSRYGTGG